MSLNACNLAGFLARNQIYILFELQYPSSVLLFKSSDLGGREGWLTSVTQKQGACKVNQKILYFRIVWKFGNSVVIVINYPFNLEAVECERILFC